MGVRGSARASIGIMQSALYAIAGPSVTWVNQLKTVEVWIMQFSPQSSPIVLAGQKFWRVPLERGRQTSYVLDLCVDISKTVQDKSKVSIND